MDRYVILTGCSGGGKSTLLAELAGRGHAVVAEPGRRIVRESAAGDGALLPWVDPVAFIRRAVEVSLADLVAARRQQGWVFFDRGLVDAAVALEFLTGAAVADTLDGVAPFHRQVFMAPPWPEIFATDDARRHSLDDALPEYERLCRAWPRLGYEVVELPRVPVAERADFVLATLGA